MSTIICDKGAHFNWVYLSILSKLTVAKNTNLSKIGRLCVCGGGGGVTVWVCECACIDA